MDLYCDLEVDVNGEEIFMVNKRLISYFSGRISKLLCKSKDGTSRTKVIFHDFPGGAANFELITRFCYNKGKVNLRPLNFLNLTCASHFMEMNQMVSGTENLCDQTGKSLEEIRFWTWSELLMSLKQCQALFLEASSLGIVDKCLNSLVSRIASSCETSPCPSTSSPDSSGFRLSCDTKSTESLKNSTFRATWWFEDLVAFDTNMIKMLVKLMVSRSFDHGIIGRFMFFYQKSRFGPSSKDEKIKIIEMVVDMLYSLHLSSISYKSLFGMLRLASNINLRKCCRDKLESMIGSQLDQASLDNLLLPSPVRTSYLYDVNFVLRLLKSFLQKGSCYAPLSRLKKVEILMDLYLVEVAPDPNLKPSKFLALIQALPDSARDSYDGVYHAVNLYLEVHSGLSEEQKIQVCSGLNFDKLSSEAFNHLTHNSNLPSKCAVQALVSQHRKLKGLLQDTIQPDFTNSPSNSLKKGKKADESEQTVIYAKKLNLSDENEKLKAHLQGMQWKVLEMEKVCRKMQVQMAKMMKSRLSSHSSAKSVPKLCS